MYYYINKLRKNKKYHTVRTSPKLNIKIVEIGKIDTPNPHFTGVAQEKSGGLR